MPFKNNKYVLPDQFKIQVMRNISQYIYSQPDRCTQGEYKKMIYKLFAIEKDFYKQLDSSDESEEEKMKDYAIGRILCFLDELYETTHGMSKRSNDDEFTKQEHDLAKKIWKERCKERERSPRAGVILLSCSNPRDERVCLLKNRNNGWTNYGHSKGKFERGETPHECAARETAEEVGLSEDYIYKQIRNKIPIIKKLSYKLDDIPTEIEHYYFIIDLPLDDVRFRLDRNEVEEIEAQSIYSLPCCKQCKDNLSDDDENDNREAQSTSYFMATCTNFFANTSLVHDILKFVDEKNENYEASKKYQSLHRYCQRKN